MRMLLKKGLLFGSVITLTAVSGASQAGGLFGDAARWVSHRTGIKQIETTANDLDNGSKKLKEEVPVLADAEEAVARPVRETARWVEENPEEALAIAAVAAVGWAACYDGCTLVSSLLVGTATGAAAIPVYSSDSDEKEDTGNTPGSSDSDASDNTAAQSDNPDDEALQEHEDFVDENSPEVDVYPYYKRDGRYDFRPALYTEKKGFGEPAMDAVVGMPTREWAIRDDGQGTIFSSRKDGQLRRNHAGIDFSADPGTTVYATMTGHIERTQNPYSNFPDLTGIRIVNEKGFASGIYYVELNEDVKMALELGHTYPVVAGETPIGVSQDPSVYPKNNGVPPHVHVYWEDPAGRKVSADGQVAILNKE